MSFCADRKESRPKIAEINNEICCIGTKDGGILFFYFKSKSFFKINDAHK